MACSGLRAPFELRSNAVRSKLRTCLTCGFAYHVASTPAALARRLVFAAASPYVNARGSTASALIRAANCSAPHRRLDGSNGRFGVTPRSDAVSPVATIDTVTSQARLFNETRDVFFLTVCADHTYSPNAPNAL